ncbi:MAG TPA: hypothetical protein VL172_01860 [Kofleriaceae bacterium]|nr:hypothetical protein [Kofleriaceae bacterium]
MHQAVLYLALYLVGLAVCLAVGPRDRPGLCCALAFPVGLAVLVAPAALFAGAGAPYGWPLLAGIAAAVLAGAAIAIRRRGLPDRGRLRRLGLGTLAFAVAATALSAVSFSVFTYDSHDIIANARVLVDDHGFGRGLMYEMDDRAPFMLIAHSLAPLLSLSFLAAFVAVAWHGFARLGVEPRRRALPIALVAAALSTVYLWQFHFLYIHENLPSAVYLFLFVALFWLAETGDADTAPIACIALAAFTLMRVENPVAAALFAGLVLLPSNLPARPLLPWLGAALVIAVGWNLALMLRLPFENIASLRPGRIRVLIALLVLVHAAWLVSRLPALERWRRHAPAMAAGLVALGLAYAFSSHDDSMVGSARALLHNLVSFDMWGVTWIGLGALAIAGRFYVKPPAAQAFSWGVPVNLGLVLLLAYGRDPYVETLFDSGMRMALHVLPLLFFYVALQLAQLSTSPAAAADADTTAPASA